MNILMFRCLSARLEFKHNYIINSYTNVSKDWHRKDWTQLYRTLIVYNNFANYRILPKYYQTFSKMIKRLGKLVGVWRACIKWILFRCCAGFIFDKVITFFSNLSANNNIPLFLAIFCHAYTYEHLHERIFQTDRMKQF